MKIKSRPLDFVVEELLDLPEFSDKGNHFIYKLEKSGLSTLEVVNHLVRRFRIHDKKINVAGMKDKHALTSQYLSIMGKELKEVSDDNFTLIPLGRSMRPVGPDLLKGNRFIITIRSLEKECIPGLINSLHEVSKYGFPNYFGEQRFGSIRHGGGFLAKCLIINDYESALKIYLSSWSSNDRKVLTYLRDYPRDFVKAINLINPRLLSLFIAAYQSYIWNEMVGEFTKINLPENKLIKFSYTAGEMVFYKALPKGLFKEFAETQIPLIDHKVKFQGEKIKEIGEGVMKTEGVEIENFRLNKIKKAFFKSVSRRLIVIPEGLELSDSGSDEISPNKNKLTISFTLPSGSYATVLLRRLGAGNEKSS